MKQQMLNVIMIALFCSLILALSQNFRTKQIIRIVCGIFMTSYILYSAMNCSRIRIKEYVPVYTEEAEEAIALGRDLSHKAMADIIKLETEAYILDKAAALNADITVSVSISDTSEPIPVSAVIEGRISPYGRQRMEHILENDLGIPKENQLWIG